MLDNLQLLFVWAPIINVQVILEGIFVGAVFALSAYGLALVWGVMNIKNLAQGDFVIMGGYMALSLSQANVPLPLILIIVVVSMFIYGWVVYVGIIRRILDQDMFVSLLATFGLSLLMQQVMNLIYGPEVQIIDLHMPNFDFFDNMVNVPSSKVLSLCLAAIIAFSVVLFMKKSRTGQAIRATAQDPKSCTRSGHKYRPYLCHYFRVQFSPLWCCWRPCRYYMGHSAFLWHHLLGAFICNCYRCWAG